MRKYRVVSGIASIAVSVAVSTALADIELVSPSQDCVVPLVPDMQKKVMSIETLADRIHLFRDDRNGDKVIRHDKLWRKASPLVLRWTTTGCEAGPWKIEIGKSPDLFDARIWYARTDKVDAVTGREIGKKDGAGEVSFTVPMANLEIGEKYFWRVTTRGRCGFDCGIRHGCSESKVLVRSRIASFFTEDVAPRWIAIEGRVANIRDIGGWRTLDGRRVRQGMAFRGQGLNDNSVTGESPGRNRLMLEDIKYLTSTLSVRTDLDLRSDGETANMNESPLGANVKYIKNPSECYGAIFTDKGKKAMAENFRLFCDRKNYPIYFHCIGGADRTGSLAYVLLSVLGVARHDVETDWESTFYPSIPDDVHDDPKYWCRESHFNQGFGKYGGENDTWNRRVELYLLDCGVTKDEIECFRSIMLTGKE